MQILCILVVCCCLVFGLDARIDSKYPRKHHISTQVKFKGVQTATDAQDHEDGEDTNTLEDGDTEWEAVLQHDSKHGHHGHQKHDKHHDNHHPEGHHTRTDTDNNNLDLIQQVQQDKKKTKKSPVAKDVPGRAKKIWRKINKFDQDQQPDDAVCEQLKCKRKHFCLLNADTGKAECIPKKLLRQKQRLRLKAAKKAHKTQNPEEEKTLDVNEIPAVDKVSSPYKEHKKAMKMAKAMKANAQKFHSEYKEKKRHHLHHMKELADHKRAPVDMVSVETDQTSDVAQNTAPEIPAYCSLKDLTDMGKRLLDWFKLLQDTDMKAVAQAPHVIEKRNSKKKELHPRDECICQAPARWQFLHLDKDSDNILSPNELEGLQTNGYEHCAKPFIQKCDHDHDGSLSDKEWCCCFADVLPPCLSERNRVPAQLQSGYPVIIPGAFVPKCSSDGFYEPVQCHSSTGYCWCVDRNGVKVEDSDTRGSPACEEGPALTENSLEQ